jgi:hypothetical protein
VLCRPLLTAPPSLGGGGILPMGLGFVEGRGLKDLTTGKDTTAAATGCTALAALGRAA